MILSISPLACTDDTSGDTETTTTNDTDTGTGDEAWKECASRTTPAGCDAVGACTWLPDRYISVDEMGVCSTEAGDSGVCLPTPGEGTCVGEDGDSCPNVDVHAWTHQTGESTWRVVHANWSETDVCLGPAGAWQYCFGFENEGIEDPPACACLCDSL